MKKKTTQKLKLHKLRIVSLQTSQMMYLAGGDSGSEPSVPDTTFCPSHPGNCYTDECPPPDPPTTVKVP